MPSSNFRDVGDFHEKFGLHRVGDYATFGPTGAENDVHLMDFRVRFLQEELVEFMTGVSDRDHEQMFDALIDLVYVALGTAHLLGYPWQAGWELVQEANMKKMRASSAEESLLNTGRGHAADICKPEGWTPPQIASLLESCGFEVKK